MSDECIETLFCIHGACKCDRIDYWMGNKCSARKEAKLNCTETKECKDTLQCVDDKCVCNEGDDWFWNGRICRHRNTLGHFCLSHNDCKASLICNDNTCTCNNTELWNGVSCSVSRPMECYDIPFKANGVYVIYPTDRIHPKPVYCVLQDGIKWTVIQRRFNGSVNFTRNWTSYKSGFGNVNGEYWLGNEYIHLISSNGRHKIRFQLWKANGTNKYADYSTFSIGNEANKYLLTVNGYSGTAGDSLINVGSQGKAAGKRFSTFDSDNDPDSRNCAALVHGGWWYSMCEYADLNQLYRRMFWVYNIGHVNKSIMMISRET
ncbi:microfibril-associated glycoprotein 4-like [Mytilus galloprovincialis]|uniref:microfibril-associated glycoprotein 4-like n=1 Tax=Mytilus galloprovincialis TaxID=29158 RepID=UPI003F7B714A